MITTVSLLITTFNWKEALRLTIQSVFTQSVLPLEIVIGDDGSKEDTRALIDELRTQSPIPIIHVWHEDKGFRLTKIRNKAIVQAKGDYIIQVDGDTILEKHFIEDHLNIAEANYFVCGSRVKIFEKNTAMLLSGEAYNFKFYNQSAHSMLNGIRVSIMQKILVKIYAKRKLLRLRGCNMAFWKKDLIEVNGYNENLTSWGHEDGELVCRLHFSGKKKKILKMGGILYHLHHKKSDKESEPDHWKEIEKVIAEKRVWCANGLDKYLDHEH